MFALETPVQPYSGRHRKDEEPKEGLIYPRTIPKPQFVYDCICYNLWNSILPPPPCPIHGHFVPSITYNTTISGEIK